MLFRSEGEGETDVVELPDGRLDRNGLGVGSSLDKLRNQFNI